MLMMMIIAALWVTVLDVFGTEIAVTICSRDHSCKLVLHFVLADILRGQKSGWFVWVHSRARSTG